VQPHPIEFVDLTVRDLARSVAFYGDHLDLQQVPVELPQGQAWLCAGSAVLRLREAGSAGRSGGWRADDLQRGFRHVGFKVSDLDERAARLRDAGTAFHKDPKDVPGGVRITFFFDPDGVLLEFVQGHLQYDRVEDAALVEREHARPAPPGPRFDHVAITVADPEKSASTYCRELGFGVAGRLIRADDPRGFQIAYLHAGDSVLELFFWGVPTIAPPDGSAGVLGFDGIGVTDADPGAVADRLLAAGMSDVGTDRRGPVVRDSDGLAIGVERGR
jgi:catechol 2,3-dioxygenase-like lactoylglutathione lyase family enzyme